MIKINVHSVVDQITNSSTTVYIYQNDIKVVKELVQEVLNLSGITDKTPDDIFYYHVFYDEDKYKEKIEYDKVDSAPKITASYKEEKLLYDKERKEQNKWFEDLMMSVLKGEVKEPQWMLDAGESDYEPDSSTYIYILPKDEKYTALADKIKSVLGSIDGEGFRNG